MKKLLLVLFAFLMLQLTAEEKYVFDIVVTGKSIGKGTAIKNTLSDGSIEYLFKSDAKTKAFFKERTSHSDIRLLYRNRELVHGKYVREKDGEWQRVGIKKENGVYKIDDDGKKMEERKPIQFTTTQFFFEEPVGIKEVWVERFSEFVSIEKVDAHTYKTNVDGSNNFYTYKDGKLVEYMIKNIVNIYMRIMD